MSKDKEWGKAQLLKKGKIIERPGIKFGRRGQLLVLAIYQLI